MKVLIIMDPGIPVPPKDYGGHERLVYMFAMEYHRMGHEVTLLVGEGSHFEHGKVITFGKIGYPKKKLEGLKDIFRCWRKLLPIYKQFDLIHNFGRLAYLLPILNHPVKKIMTYGREISSGNIKRITKLPNKNLVFTGCSTDLISRGGLSGRWETVYNAIEFSKYELKERVDNDAPFVFLGRLERVKGIHHAISFAKATGSRLLIAGNISSLPEEREYYEQEILPHVDDQNIRYLGALNDQQKNHYLGTCKALLFPIDWNEPFGMVMVEAMACGTPVIAFNKGSVPEVVDEGITGYKVKNVEEMIAVLPKINDIDRRRCRQQAADRFDVNVIATHYLNLF